MVVKQDVDEAFDLIRQQRMVVVILLSVTVVAVGIVAISWPGRSRGRSARRPQVAERVASGDLTAQVDDRAPRARPASSSRRSRR